MTNAGTYSLEDGNPLNSVEYACLPGSPQELERFKKLQLAFGREFADVFPGHHAQKAVVIVPSLTLDQEILAKIKGQVFYEERMLCLLMLLRMPNTHVIFVTSVPVDPVIIDYYLHLLPGITGFHARQRLTLLSCYDAEPLSLTQKILERPRLMERIRTAIPPGYSAHLACFNVTPYERTLAVKLGIPIYGCDPDLYGWGNKSRSRQIFRECGLSMPEGFEDVKTLDDIIEALSELREKNPLLEKAVIKMNDGFSGEGNAIFPFEGAPGDASRLRQWIRNKLPSALKIVASGMSFEEYRGKFEQMQGIVEEFITGSHKTSPSVQCRITPLGKVEVISTHDQSLGGESGQVFLGADFPASEAYSREIGIIGRRVAEALKEKGVLGRFSIDFLTLREQYAWKHFALEINLRKGGTTHPYLMLQFLTNGEYDQGSGIYTTANGQPRCYYATDNLHNEKYRGLTPQDLLEIAIGNELHYDATLQEGVVFHLISALSQYGKLGLLCIGKTPEKTRNIYNRTVEVLNNL